MENSSNKSDDYTKELTKSYEESLTNPKSNQEQQQNDQTLVSPTPDIAITKNGTFCEYKDGRPYCPRAFSIKANKPIEKSFLCYYFEIKVESLNRDFSIGLTTLSFPVNKSPGITRKFSPSYGFTSNGRVYFDKSLETTGSRYTIGDIVGCGVDFTKRKVFFTVNGLEVSTIPNCTLKENLYPTICLFYPGDKVSVNFGSSDFKFNYDKYYDKIKNDFLESIAEIDINKSDIYNIIINYLCYQGFSKTFNALEKKNKIFKQCIENSETMLSKKYSENSLENTKTATRKTSSFNVEEILGNSETVSKNQAPSSDEIARTDSSNELGVKTRSQKQTPSDKFDLSYKQKERSCVREAQMNGDVQKATNLIEKNFKESKKNSLMILTLKVQQFFEIVSKDDMKGLKFLRQKLRLNYEDQILLLDINSKTNTKSIYFKVKDQINQFSKKFIREIWQSQKQRELTADTVNKCLMQSLIDPVENTMKHIQNQKKNQNDQENNFYDFIKLPQE